MCGPEIIKVNRKGHARTLNNYVPQKTGVWILNVGLKFSTCKVREKQGGGDLESSTSTCTIKTRDQLGSPLLDPCNLSPCNLRLPRVQGFLAHKETTTPQEPP